MTNPPRHHRSTPASVAAWFVLSTHAFAAILVDFDQAEYTLPGAASPLTVGVVIDADDTTPGIQPLANGLFSVGLKVEFLEVKAQAVSPSDVAPVADLNNFGPAPGADLAVAPGEAAFRGNVALPLPGNPVTPYTGSSLATFTLDNLAPSTDSYTLFLDFYKPLGPTEDSFVDGLGTTLDSQIVFGSAIVNVGLVPGDTDCDGDVDLIDLDTLGANFGVTGAPGGKTIGDFDGDGDVDLIDLDTLGANFGTGVPATAVPEPTGFAILAAPALAACLRRRVGR